MPQLIKELRIGSGPTIQILYPPDSLPDLPSEDWDLGTSQGFVWYSDFVAFFKRGDIGDYWAKIYLADRLELQPEMARAIVVPFEVPQSDDLLISGSYYDDSTPFNLPPDRYKLLFETRYLTDSEIESCGDHYNYLLEYVRDPDIEFDDERRPELCCFTFIPTQEAVEPEILFPTYEDLVKKHQTTKLVFRGFDPRRKLVLHHKPRPEAED